MSEVWFCEIESEKCPPRVLATVSAAQSIYIDKLTKILTSHHESVYAADRDAKLRTSEVSEVWRGKLSSDTVPAVCVYGSVQTPCNFAAHRQHRAADGGCGNCDPSNAAACAG